MTNVDVLPHSPTDEKKVSGVEEDKKSLEKKSKRGKKGRETDNAEEDNLQTAHQMELAQDAAIDPAPFQFKPFQLAHMLDPKNIQTLMSFGGIDGLLRGLGTNADTGLATKPQHANSSESSREPSQGASPKHDPANMEASEYSNDRVPVIVLTDPNENLSEPSENDKPVVDATVEDRRRVYGENVLPTRITKTLLQLMWAALKDKVLVSVFFAVPLLLILTHLS